MLGSITSAFLGEALSRKSSQRREDRLKTLGYVGLGVLALTTVGIVGAVALAPAPQESVSSQVQSYYEGRATATPTPKPAVDHHALPAGAGAVLWSDAFDRPDGEPGVADSGQTYLTHRTNQQLPLIVGGKLMSVPQSPSSVGSGYVALRLPVEPYHLAQKFTIQGKGTGQNSAVSIVPGHGETIPAIIDYDIHAIHTRDGVAVQVRNKAANDYETVNSWPVKLKTDGTTVYEWSITRTAPDTIRVVDATGQEHFSKDARYATLWGPDVYIQAVDAANNQTPGDTTAITEMLAYGSL